MALWYLTITHPKLVLLNCSRGTGWQPMCFSSQPDEAVHQWTLVQVMAWCQAGAKPLLESIWHIISHTLSNKLYEIWIKTQKFVFQEFAFGNSISKMITSLCWLSAPSSMAYSLYVPSQWEMALHSNAISHWLGIYTEWSLILPTIMLHVIVSLHSYSHI